jgi:hypothetical protein
MTIPAAGAPDAIVHTQAPFGFRVAPPVVWKRAGNEFVLLNATDVTVRVIFPVLNVDPREADVAPHNRQTFVIDPDAQFGAYDYYVEIAPVTQELLGFNLRAIAGSDPRIIID